MKLLSKLKQKGYSWNYVANCLKTTKREAYRLITRHPQDLSFSQAQTLSEISGLSLDEMFLAK